MNLLKQASSNGHAQRCKTISESVASRLVKELFPLILDRDTTMVMIMEGHMRSELVDRMVKLLNQQSPPHLFAQCFVFP